LTAENEKRRDERKKQTAEVFTPDKLVNQMLSKLPKEVWKKGKTFCDPAVGNGQFVIWVLIRKIQRGQKPLEALKTVYGVDIMKDNIQECRMRLLKVCKIFGEKITKEHVETIFKNIVWVNPEIHPSGSLEYHFEFNGRPKKANVERWMQWIHEEDVLEQVELPVDEEIFSATGVEQLDFDE
jgi:hypothetical protein